MFDELLSGIMSSDKAPLKKPHYDEDYRHGNRASHPAMLGSNSVPYPLHAGGGATDERPPELPASPPPMHPPTLSPDMEDVRVSTAAAAQSFHFKISQISVVYEICEHWLLQSFNFFRFLSLFQLV